MEPIETEVITLNIAWAMIDDLVNWSIFDGPLDPPFKELRFNTPESARIFLILLADLLSDPHSKQNSPSALGIAGPSQEAAASERSYLRQLNHVARNPALLGASSEFPESISRFRTWLDAEFTSPNLYFQSVGETRDIKMSRFLAIRICGDVAKHNPARLSSRAAKIRTLLGNHGLQLSEDESFLALQDFYEWFTQTFLGYHASTMA
ncbi:hypothetical protein ACQ5SO_16755 [Rhodovulum sp. DZ06]|uniref:hypothetical protein n=1 Tax=Rhodovulum sp. DZ06 TaxID=3425126 RepID=UPI003D32B273